MGVVDISKVRKRIISILLATRVLDTYPDTVDGSVATYSNTDDITRAALEADIAVCLDIAETVGHAFRSTFIAVTSALSSGDLIPAHLGVHGDVEVNDGTGYAGGQLADSKDEILTVRTMMALYPSPGRWYFIEDDKLYHTGTQARMWNPSVAITSACQAPDAYEEAVVCGGITLLLKNGESPDVFAYYQARYNQCRQLIRSRELVIPVQQAYEKQAA